MLENKSELWKWCKSKSGNSKRLAISINVSRTFISNVSNGNQPVPINLISKISKITGIKPKDLRPDLYEIFKEDLA